MVNWLVMLESSGVYESSSINVEEMRNWILVDRRVI